MLAPETRAQIRRLFFAEHWKVGTIAEHLRVHHDAVRHAIDVDSFVAAGRVVPSALDPYARFVDETLSRYPRLRATRVHEMLHARGYRGSVVQVRRLVRRLRPRQAPEAFLRLETMPGEQGQVDWGSFGHVQVGRAKRALSAFVMVLSWSRAMHVTFTLDQRLESFLLGHVDAFAYFGGAPRVILYDNLKSAVLERHRESIRFHPRLIELCSHYHFEPRPCAVARGNEKGKVERLIRFLRDRFFAARSFRDVDDLNAQFHAWRESFAHARDCPGTPELTVAQALVDERKVLLALPQEPFATDVIVALRAQKTPYLRFDQNDYSIPPDLTGKPLTLLASPTTVRILDGHDEVARHRRCFDAKRRIEDARHIKSLVDKKRAARAASYKDTLVVAVPIAERFLEAAVQRNLAVGIVSQQLLQLLDDYGRADFEKAINEALEKNTIAVSAVATLIDQARRRRRQQPLVKVVLSDDPRIKSQRITPHDLRSYDDLGHKDDDKDDDDDGAR
jgi:transposase